MKPWCQITYFCSSTKCFGNLELIVLVVGAENKWPVTECYLLTCCLLLHWQRLGSSVVLEAAYMPDSILEQVETGTNQKRTEYKTYNHENETKLILWAYFESRNTRTGSSLSKTSSWCLYIM